MASSSIADKIHGTKTTIPYSDTQKAFVTQVRSTLGELKTEISERNEKISSRDSYIYGDLLESSLDIPIGHDHTPVNWLRRTVEIHKIQFMGRPFQVVSTYDTKDNSIATDDEDKQRLTLENKKQKEFAELRKNTVDAIIQDNGGHALFMDGAESASAVGDWVVKAWYDDEDKKYVLSPIEAVENCYAIWKKNDFREFEAFGYVYQISKQSAISDYGCSETVVTSVLGAPLEFIGENVQSPNLSGQPMVTVMEVTGKITGWGSQNGKVKTVSPGNENELNALIIGTEIKRLVDEEKKLPRHYIFPNKKQRRRPWGASDVSEAAININATYVETLSDWRTLASKVNFPKFRGFNFGPDTVVPKFKSRRIQVVPLAEGQDLQLLPTGDANQQDFKSQMDELKEQFVRETGISRVLFDDPSVTLNSNQALLTSMKPTSDIAESKKQLWTPILQRMFSDAIKVIGEYDETVKELADEEMSWNLKVQWPSVMQKEDPIYQQMLLNRKNAGTMSIQSYLEAQGETKEELDRIREEMGDPITAAIHGNQLALVAQALIQPAPDPNAPDKPKVSVNLRGDLTPAQEANLASTQGFQDGPFGATMGPQGNQGMIAQENVDNANFLSGDYPNQTPVFRDAQGNETSATPPAQVNTQANNQEGTGVVSQPGSGATTTSAQGAINQTTQNNGG
jgi:hypothetical protein